MIVVDAMVGRRIARSRGLQVTGTLGILAEDGRLGWIDLPAALAHLQQTTFRVSESLIQHMLEQDGAQS